MGLRSPAGRHEPHWTLRPRGVLRASSLLLFAHLLFYAALLRFDAIDDAYISFRYARNVARGLGPVFNPGERVEGYTNFLWMLLAVPMELVHLAPHVWTLFSGLLLAYLTLLTTYRFAAARQPWAGAVAALLLAADGSFALWSISGMETIFFTFLCLLGALRYLAESEGLTPRRRPTSGLLFGLAALTRPEGALFLGLTCLHQALWALPWRRGEGRRNRGAAPVVIRARGSVWAAPGVAQHWSQAALRAGIFLTCYLPYFIWRWRYYGYLLPNTYYDKVSGDSAGGLLARGITYVQHFAALHFYFLPLILVAVPLALGLYRREISYFLTLFVALSAYVVYVGGDWSVGRFFVPVLPYYAALVGLGAAVAWPRLAAWLRANLSLVDEGQTLARMLGGFTVAYLLVFSSGLGEWGLFMMGQDAGRTGLARTAAGRWLARNAPPTALLAVDAAGQVPYYSGLRTVDLYGLTDVTMAHQASDKMGKILPGHDKLNLPYVLSRKPDYVVLYHKHPGLLPPEYEPVADNWASHPRDAEIISIYRRNVK